MCVFVIVNMAVEHTLGEQRLRLGDCETGRLGDAAVWAFRQVININAKCHVLHSPSTVLPPPFSFFVCIIFAKSNGRSRAVSKSEGLGTRSANFEP